MAKNIELEALIAGTGKNGVEFAKAAGVSVSGLRKYLAGKVKSPSGLEVDRMAEVAGVDYQTMRRAITSLHNAPTPPALVPKPPSTATLPPDEDDVDRRNFLITGAAAVATANLLFHGFSEQLFSDPRSRDSWTAIIEAHGHDYMSVGADEMRTRIAKDLSKIQTEPQTEWRWAITAKLMTLYAKTFPGSDGEKALSWYRMAAIAADRSGDPETQIWVRGRAAIALGYEGAAAPLAYQFGIEATEIANTAQIKSMGLLNAQMGGAHAATLLGDMSIAESLYDSGRRTFDEVGIGETISDFSVPWWRQGVYSSLLLARMGRTADALQAQSEARKALPSNLPRFATHLDLHTALLIGKSGDKAGAADFADRTLAKLPASKHSLTLRLLACEIKDL